MITVTDVAQKGGRLVSSMAQACGLARVVACGRFVVAAAFAACAAYQIASQRWQVAGVELQHGGPTTWTSIH